MRDFKPGSNYRDLLIQAKAMYRVREGLQRQLDIYRKFDQRFDCKRIIELEALLASEQEMNKLLTQELEEVNKLLTQKLEENE
ncbi:MAG TPA: hypothetical protein V6C96_01870 [Vampirovibrionales bacterium]